MNLNYKDQELEKIFFNKEFIELLKISNKEQFLLFEAEEYKYFSYQIRLNILSFLKGTFSVKFNVIGLPISLGEKGYIGNIEAIIEKCKKDKGITYIINMDKKATDTGLAVGNTLYNCIFYNKYDNFSLYLHSLKSNYRKRIKVALKKGESLKIEKIQNKDFSNEMYQLYLNTYENSKYKLECLTKEFFINTNGDIYVFYDKSMPVAFFLVKGLNNSLNFLFGGFDYTKRDTFDLYYNMLIEIIKIGIDNNYETINLGQTAETSKMRLGAVLEPKYFCIITRYKILNFIIRNISKIFQYKYERKNHEVFKENY